jgi:PAS domain S-box-containing protein
VVVLPEGAPLRARVGALLARSNATMAGLPVPSEADLALVDLTALGGRAALEALLKTPEGLRLSVLVLGTDGKATAGVVDSVSEANLDEELPVRLERARAQRSQLKDASARQREMQVLLELTARFAETADADALLHDVTRRLAEDLEIDRAALVLIDDNGVDGIILAASDDPALKDLRIDLARYPEIREVVRTKKPVIVEDAPSHPLLEDVREKVTARGIQNIAALPLALSGKVLGALLLRRSSRRGAFHPAEVSFLTTVAHATAVALRNAQRIDAFKGRVEKETSARIAAEEKAKSLKRYEAWFEHLSDGVAILDAQACVLSLNPAGLKLFDVTDAEARGRHINALANPTDDGLLLDMLYKVASGQPQSDVDLHARTASGKRLTLAVSVGAMREEGAAAILTLRDVTLQRQMAEELSTTKDFLERLIDSSVDAVIAADMKGNIILFNKTAEVITGYAAAEARAKLNVSQLYPEGVAKDVMHRLRSKDFGGVGRLTTTRQEIRTRAGDRIPVNMTASILYEGARESATVGIFTDLRDRLNLERKLSDVETRLEESEKNAVLVALAGTAAHELNQPLTSVMGYAELLKRKLKEGDPSWRPVDIIYREAERMAEIVRKIGKITRYETKAYVGNQQIVDLEKASAHDE